VIDRRRPRVTKKRRGEQQLEHPDLLKDIEVPSEEGSAVRGGRKPTAPGPVPIPYPNTDQTTKG
jgi:hypothetical protein